MNYQIVIPAYEPEFCLIDYVKELEAAGFSKPLIVDDGSGAAYETIFSTLKQMGCTVLTHSVNRGKGAALKTAFRYLLDAETDLPGVITVDCDGQHTVKDVTAVKVSLSAHPDTLVLGCRTFGKNTPGRSALGNRMMSWAMRVVYGIDLKDTQTGLRGLPPRYLAQIAQLKGDRYEYELNMLLFARQQALDFTVVPIDTIYFDNNSGSHFRTIRDALPILKCVFSGIVQYSTAAALSVVVDVFVYCMLVKLLLAGMPLAMRLTLAAALARTISSGVNYLCNRQLPYVQDKSFSGSLPRYYLLWLFQLAASIGGAYLLCVFAQMDEMAAKLLVDIVLAVISYQIQLHWVFARRKETMPHWNTFGRLFKRLVRLFLFRWKCEGTSPAAPVVYVVHHQNLYGPVHTVVRLDKTVHVWALHVFCDRTECFHQYYHYTFTERFGWPKPCAFLAAGFLSLVVPPLLRSVGAVPVYRGSAAVRKTMRLSQELLLKGESIVICPDVDYANTGSLMGETYAGFLALDQYYRKETGHPLAFVPVHCSSAYRKICIGEPVYCTGSGRKERRKAAQILAHRVNVMACSCGDAFLRDTERQNPVLE